MAFYVGQKVVCVDDRPFFSEGVPVPLVLGRIYTVAGFDNHDCLVLVEQPGRNFAGWRSDLGYQKSRFRPVVERKTDISIFKAMLNPSDVRVSA